MDRGWGNGDAGGEDEGEDGDYEAVEEEILDFGRRDVSWKDLLLQLL